MCTLPLRERMRRIRTDKNAKLHVGKVHEYERDHREQSIEYVCSVSLSCDGSLTSHHSHSNEMK